MQKVKKPFAWYGGKESLAPTLVSLLPVHKVYVEPFAGSAALLFAKEPSPIEIINDLDSGVANCMRVLRNPVQAAELQYLLTLTPYAREEYYACLEHWEAEADPVEKARQWLTGVMQSMNSSIRNTGGVNQRHRGLILHERGGVVLRTYQHVYKDWHMFKSTIEILSQSSLLTIVLIPVSTLTRRILPQREENNAAIAMK